MRITIAIDSLKGSLSSIAAGNAVKSGILEVYPDAQVQVRPMADGGEGTVDALTEGMGGVFEDIQVTGPLGAPVTARYGILSRTRTAIMEMSAAAGITLIPYEARNPMETTTYGVGEMIKDAVQKGCRNFIIGIGGSATNDAGIGMLQALGFQILDQQNHPVSRGAKGLAEAVLIRKEEALPELSECTFQIACDVNNPLCGDQGCSAVYGPQKGATQEMVCKMDEWMRHYAEIVKKTFPEADQNQPGAGAAGGIGYAFSSFLNGNLKPGIQIVLKETKLEEYVKDSDLVITGEGRLDGQSIMGKAPIGVAGLAKKYHLPVIAFSGCVTEDAVVCNLSGIDAFFPILRTVVSKEEAMDPANAERNMEAAAEQVFRLIRTVKETMI